MEGLSVILKYKRREDRWICPLCETENYLQTQKCILCGGEKTIDAKIAEAWSEKNEANTVPPVVANTQPKQQIPYVKTEKFFKETEGYMPPPGKSHKLRNFFITFLIIAVIVGVFAFVISGSKGRIYDEAMDAFEVGDYQTAIEKFEQLPSDYEDVSEMIVESKYQMAIEHMSYGDMESAKTIFEEIIDYADSETMITECDYRVAENYCNNGEYVKAMNAFNLLGSYSDSTSMFEYAEDMLIYENDRSGYFDDENFMMGRWSDGDGFYVDYDYDSAGFNLPHSDAKEYKLTSGIHYHSKYGGSNWKKQWIYQRIDQNTVEVYNYTDGSTYVLTRE